MSFPPNRYTDVVIVGSGLSGLASAYQLNRLGLKCIVYEATDTIGGRTRSLSLQNGEKVSYGGTWILLGDTSLLGLACKIECYPFLPSIKLFGGGMYHILRHPYLLFSLWFLGRRFHKYQYNFPESDPDIVTYDTLSLEAWLNSQTSIENCKDAVRNWFLLIEYLPPDLSEVV